MIRRILCSLFLSSFALTCFCQSFDSFEGQAAKYHARMELFFPSRTAELNSRHQLLDSIQQFIRQNDKTIGNLQNRLDTYEQLLRSLHRHYQYIRLLAEKDRKDTTAKTTREVLSQQLDVFSAKVDSILQRPVFGKVAPPPLYTYLMQQEHQQAKHTLKPTAEIENAGLEKQLDNLTDQYDDLIDTIKAGKDKTATLRNYARHGEQFAQLLINITRIKASQSVSHHWADAQAEYYNNRLQLPEDSVKAVFRQVAASANILQSYQQLPAGTALHWQPLIFSDVRKLVNDALLPLGSGYQAHFARLLDPDNGLLDIAYTADRAGGGNSFGTTGTPIGLYMQRFDGGFANLSTLIHEGGHAIHRQLISENNVIPSYATGPNFLSEAIAMLNELFLFDELKRRAKTNPEKAAYSRIFADKLAREIFISAEEGSFEQNLYDEVAAGKIHGFQDINILYAGIMRTYDANFDQIPERQNEWIAKRLVFEDPLYNANYLFAILITCKLYTLHQQDPQHFAAKYHAMLSQGFNAPAASLLGQHFNIKLNYNELLKDALKLLQEQSGEVRLLAQ
jgi:oligoendopeptidase F